MKETISKVKRQKIIANEATDKQLISKIYKQPVQLNSRKISELIKKWIKEPMRHFPKEDTDGESIVQGIIHFEFIFMCGVRK